MLIQSRFFVAVLVLTINFNAFSQSTTASKDNILWPNKLILGNQIGYDSAFTYQPASSKINLVNQPLFRINKNKDWVNQLIDKSLNGTVPIYNPIGYEHYPYITKEGNKKLNDAQLHLLLGEKYDTVMDIEPNGEIITQVLYHEIDKNEINSINFVEEWILSETPFAFEKKVIALEPIRKIERDYNGYIENAYSKTFRVYNNEASASNKLVPVTEIEYEHFFNIPNAYFNNNYADLVKSQLMQNDEDEENDQYTGKYNAPFFNIFNQRILIETLLKNVFNGNLKVSDYAKKTPLTPAQAKTRIFIKQKTKVYNEEGIMVEKIITDDVSDEIVALLFVEIWYFDAEKISFKKRIKAIAPIRYYIDYQGSEESVQRVIPFIIQLN